MKYLIDLRQALIPFTGAKNVRSLDGSNYEGATDVHDLNDPLPPALSKMFSVVHDGGTLEHIFKAVQAFKNGMEMVRVGGHFIQATSRTILQVTALGSFRPN